MICLSRFVYEMHLRNVLSGSCSSSDRVGMVRGRDNSLCGHKISRAAGRASLAHFPSPSLSIYLAVSLCASSRIFPVHLLIRRAIPARDSLGPMPESKGNARWYFRPWHGKCLLGKTAVRAGRGGRREEDARINMCVPCQDISCSLASPARGATI